MKKLKQISEQIKENITQFIEDAEMSESVLEKSIADMKQQIQMAKKLVATAIADEQKLKRAYREAIDAANRCENRVNILLQNNDDQEANELQQQSKKYLQLAHDLEQRILAQETVVAQLKTDLLEVYHRCNNTSNQVETLIQDQKHAKTRAEFYKVLAELEGIELDIDINQVVQKAEEMAKKAESEARMWEQRNQRNILPTETTQNDFNVDEALAVLKKDILGSSQND